MPPTRIVPLVGVVAAVLMFGCGSPAPTAPTPAPVVPSFAATSLSIKQLTNSYAIGDTVQLSATGVAADGTSKDLTTAVAWQSMDPSVATVSSAGLVTAVGIGLADFRATYQTVTAGGRIAVDQPGCTYRVSYTTVSFIRKADGGSATVTTQPGCPWTVAGDADWMSVSRTCVQVGSQCVTTSNPGGASGSGRFDYKVSAYDVPLGTDPRAGRLMVRWNTPTLGQNVAVTQTSGCIVGLSPTTVSIGADGGSVHIFALVQNPLSHTDPWQVTSRADWIALTFPSNGAWQYGDGDVHFNVSANPSASARVGTIVACGTSTTTVTQAGR